MLIRRAVPSDCERVIEMLLQIAELHHKGRPEIFKPGVKKYDEEKFAEIIADETKPLFIAEDGGIVGYCFCQLEKYENHPVMRDRKILYIDDLCVDETRRGQSIGRGLVDAVKKYAGETGVSGIELNVWEFNENAVKFYESCGFTAQRRRMELTSSPNICASPAQPQ